MPERIINYITLTLAVSLVAAFLTTPLDIQARNILVRIDGVTLPIQSSDQHPVISDETVLVPMRAVMEALGFDTIWNEHSLTAEFTGRDRIVRAMVGRRELLVNDEHVSIPLPVQIVNNRIMINAHALKEAAGVNVRWDPLSQWVNVITPESRFNPRNWPVNSTNWPVYLPVYVPGSIYVVENCGAFYSFTGAY